ncbi:MAG: hypothetical protein NTZ31_06725, partial [Actinobacteria bacterium]|nr:hypothetical protein [Actinomycetota bacterium]
MDKNQFGKQKGLGIHQVPITTKPPLGNYCITSQLLAVTKFKEESPYKPEAFDPRLMHWAKFHF